MSFRTIALLLLFGAVCAWLSWLMVLFTVNPTTAAWWGFLVFYITLFLSLFGTLALTSFIVRVLFSRKRATVSRVLGICVRHSLLWTLAAVAALALQGQRLLTWWVSVLLVIIFIALEYMIVSTRKEGNQETYGTKNH